MDIGNLISALPGAAAQGLIWGIMAIGVYLTYRILDVADLTVDGTMATGGAVCVMLTLAGLPMPVALLASVAVGMLAGLVTGIFHTIMGIPAILAGILTQLGLWSINLRILGMANKAISVDKYNLLVSLRYIPRTLITVFIVILLVIGLLYGSISGYAGGKVDLAMMRIVDIIYSLPDTLMVILLSVVLNQIMGDALKGTVFAKVGNNMISLFVVFGLLYWVGMARLVRGQILTIKTNEYVLAARAMGAKPGRIIRKHILPNCMSVIFVSVALQIPSAIFTESFLSFIGLGVQAPMPSLGSLANAARGGMQSYPFKMIFPAIGICLIVLSFNLLGDGLRDAFDPKLRR